MKNIDLAHILLILVMCLVVAAANAELTIQAAGTLSAAQQTQYRYGEADYENQARDVIRAISERNEQELLIQKRAGVAPADLKLKQCPAEYESVLRPDSTGDLNIHVGFGYLNANTGLTEDLFAFEKLREQLLKPCPTQRLALARSADEAKSSVPLHQLCGFKELSAAFKSSGATQLTKQIKLPDGSEKRVILEVTTSSVTPSDQQNKTTHLNEQRAKSFEASNAFYSALGLKNVVMYIGHSRFGKGPDFYPLGFLDGTERIEKVLQALKLATHRPGMVGLFSCDSADHFFGQLDSVLDQNTRLLLTSKETKTPFQTFLASLNGALSLQCESDLSEILSEFDGVLLTPN